ncbi:MAG TPA: glycosyltransferase [Firmicutes bacterium]|nr:glycosyltransferase [Bacillota bacterium]
MEQERLKLEKYSLKFKFRYSGTLKREKTAIKNADGVLVMCNQDLDYIKKNFKDYPELTKAIPPGHYGIPEPVRRLNERSGDVLVVAWYGERKGFNYINSALEQLIKEFPSLKITYAATVKPEQEVNDCLPKDLKGRIRIIPNPIHDDLLEYMDNHKIFLLPSLFEGYGMVYLEAMSRGMAVIATDTGGAPELIENEANGFLIQRRRTEEIIRIIRMIINKPEAFVNLSENAVERVRNMTWDNTAKLTLEFYNEVLSGVR